MEARVTHTLENFGKDHHYCGQCLREFSDLDLVLQSHGISLRKPVLSPDTGTRYSAGLTVARNSLYLSEAEKIERLKEINFHEQRVMVPVRQLYMKSPASDDNCDECHGFNTT